MNKETKSAKSAKSDKLTTPTTPNKFHVGQKLWSRSLREVEIVAVGRVWLRCQEVRNDGRKYRKELEIKVNKETLESSPSYVDDRWKFYADREWVVSEIAKDEYFNFVEKLLRHYRPSKTVNVEAYKRLADAAAEVFSVERIEVDHNGKGNDD